MPLQQKPPAYPANNYHGENSAVKTNEELYAQKVQGYMDKALKS
jgi:hypothetical protein